MQACIEELIEVSRASRGQNPLMIRNMNAGQKLRLNCISTEGDSIDQQKKNKMRTNELNIMCMGNPRTDIEARYIEGLEKDQADGEFLERLGALSIDHKR